VNADEPEERNGLDGTKTAPTPRRRDVPRIVGLEIAR
jgi:hypothetical protein